MQSLRNNARAEEILNLVLVKVFALKCFEVLVIANEALYWRNSKLSWNDLLYA